MSCPGLPAWFSTHLGRRSHCMWYFRMGRGLGTSGVPQGNSPWLWCWIYRFGWWILWNCRWGSLQCTAQTWILLGDFASAGAARPEFRTRTGTAGCRCRICRWYSYCLRAMSTSTCRSPYYWGRCQLGQQICTVPSRRRIPRIGRCTSSL